MTTITFDTLKFANTLKEAGVPATQAEAEARAVAAAIRETLDDAVTSPRETSDLRADLREFKQTTERDFSDLRKEIHAAELRLTIRLGAMMAVAVGIVAALVKLL